MNSRVLNFNIGLLGHIDSGKTSLAKALSAMASTAAFDKNPQSQERGITIDLGFSSFSAPFPERLKTTSVPYDTLLFTLVDCPGHASLIRTIMGGAQIIDLMFLVVDATKGIQTQTAECLVVGQILCDHLIVVVNKIDQFPENKREVAVSKVMKKIGKTLEQTKFSGAPMVPVAANPAKDGESPAQPIGIETLIDVLVSHVYLPSRSPEGPFVFAVDHCFAIRGQGTVMTGTVIQGQVSVSDMIEVPTAQLTRKVKSIQMFKKPIEKAMQGDRVGICVTQFDAKLLERGTACTPGCLQFADAVIAVVEKIPYYKSSCRSGSKFHVTIMHDTVIARCTFFGLPQVKNAILEDKKDDFNFNNDYIFQEELIPDKPKETSDSIPIAQYALLEFDRHTIISKDVLLIGSRLEMDVHANACRLAFHGKVAAFFTKQQLATELSQLKVYKTKRKEGVVERMSNEHEVICRDLFKKETKIDLFVNFKVKLSSGEDGIIEGSFGQSGKAKIRIPSGLSAETVQLLGRKKGKKDSSASTPSDIVKVFLTFKRYMYDPKKRMLQN